MSRKAFVRRNERLRISDKTEAWECIREISPRYGIRVIVIFRNFVEIGRVERPPLPLEKKKGEGTLREAIPTTRIATLLNVTNNADNPMFA